MYQNKTVILLRKTPSLIIFWCFSFVVLMIVIFYVVFMKFEMKYYYLGFITKENNQYYVKIYSTDKEVGKLNQKEVYINGKRYPLAYIKIKESYTITESLENVHEVYLNVDLPKKIRIENLRVDVLFEIKQTTLMEHFLKNWKQGVYETIR